jgi:hypothetical protein
MTIGVLPMANVLIAVAARGQAGRRKGVSAPFCLGFSVAGTAALGVYLALVLAFPVAVKHAVDDPLAPLEPLAKRGAAGIATFVPVGLAWTQAPILAPALLGGLVWRRRSRHAASGHAAVPPRPLGIGGLEPATTRLVDPAGSR